MLSLRFLCKYCEQASEPTKAIPLIINLLMLLRPVYSFPQSDKNASRDLPACSVRYRPRHDEGTVSAWHRYELPNAVINMYYRVVGRPFSRSREVDLACASNVACTVSAIF
jgi:hypothetical protein